MWDPSGTGVTGSCGSLGRDSGGLTEFVYSRRAALSIAEPSF